MKTALYEIAETKKLNFRFTTNQNVILADISDKDKNQPSKKFLRNIRSKNIPIQLLTSGKIQWPAWH